VTKRKTNDHDEKQMQEHLQYLKLTSIRDNYEPEAKTAAEKHLSHVEYLARLIDGEAALRLDRRPDPHFIPVMIDSYRLGPQLSTRPECLQVERGSDRWSVVIRGRR